MKRLIFLMVVLGLVAYHATRDIHVHDTYFVFGPHGRQIAQAEFKAAHRAKRDAEAARRQALFAIEKARFKVDQAERQVRESVDGIPVPIVPGTRVTVASPAPPAPPRPPAPPTPPSIIRTTTRPTDPAHVRRVEGRLSATEERARADARRQLREEVAAWIAPEVPSSYEVPNHQLDTMIVAISVKPIVKPYATVYVAEIDAEFSDARRAELVREQQQVVVRRRMLALAGLLGFVLVCLAAVSGYIRTDEATKGYYTNRLRMLAAAGVGAAGTVIYQMIA